MVCTTPSVGCQHYKGSLIRASQTVSYRGKKNETRSGLDSSFEISWNCQHKHVPPVIRQASFAYRQGREDRGRQVFNSKVGSAVIFYDRRHLDAV